MHFSLFLFSSHENILPRILRLINFTRIVVVFYTFDIIKKERENPITKKILLFLTQYFFRKITRRIKFKGANIERPQRRLTQWT